MSKWKRWISTILAFGLIITSIPMQSFAANTPFVSISLSDTDSRQAYVVQEKGDELLFSVEDLRKISGYEVKKEEDSIIFSKGLKTVRVDTKKDRVYLFEDVGLSVQRDLKTKPQMEEKQTYLPGSELLPLLNVSIFQMDDEVYAMRDVDSVWEVLEDIDTKKYEFDFERACTNIGVDSEKTKFLAYMKKNGVASILDNIPMDGGTAKYYMGDYIEYSDIFEDMFLEADSVTEFLDETAENLDFISDSLSMIRVGTPLDSVSDVLEVGAAVSEYEIGIAQAGMIAEDKLEMLKTVYDSHGMTHKYGKAMRSGASSVVSTYDTGNWGIICKGTVEIFQGLEDTLNWNPLGKFLDVLCDQYGINRKVTSQELKNLDVIVAYDALANAARAAMKDYGFQYGTDCYRYHALIYLYCSENSWRAMAEYADRIGAEQADDFFFIADSCQEVRGRLFNCALSKTNDNRGFDKESDADESQRLREVFASITKRDESGPQLSMKENSSQPAVSAGTGEGDTKAGSNNLNMNYIKDDYCNFPATCMVSDGENLFMTMPSTLAFGVTGILRYPLASAVSSMYDGTLVYEITIPEDQLDPSLKYPEYGEPIAIGMYDKENLCVVMPTGERDYDFDKGTSNDVVRLEKIPAFDVTYAGEGNVYDTFTMTECVERPKLVGEWFYFERDLESGVHGLFRRSIYSGKEEQIAEHYVGYREETGVERLTYILDEESLIAIRYNNQKSEMLIMDIGNGSIESVELDTEGEVVGVYDGYVYFTGEPANYKLPLYRMKKELWEPELVLTNTSYGYRYNFYQNTMFLLSDDDVFVIPLDAMGRDYSDYEKIHIYTAVSVELAPPLPDSGIWIWDGKIWTYSCSRELNSTLKVLGECEGIISQFTAQMEAQEIQESVEETEPLNDGNELNLSGIYSIGSMSDDAPAIQFHPDTETVQIWNFDIFSFTEQKECYLVAGYRVVDGGIEISAPYGYEFYQVEPTNDGITISKDGVSHFFEMAPTF